VLCDRGNDSPTAVFSIFLVLLCAFHGISSAHGAQTAAESKTKTKMSWWMTGEEGPGEDEPGIRIGFQSLEQFPALDNGQEPSQVKHDVGGSFW
jgi:hypothetical protein